MQGKINTEYLDELHRVMWFSWQSIVTPNSGLLPHQHHTYPTHHPDHGGIISFLFNTLSPSGNSFPCPFWITPFFLALTFIYFATAPTPHHPPKSFQAPTVILTSKTSFCMLGRVVVLVHFGSQVPEGRRGGRFSLWLGVLHPMAIPPPRSQGCLRKPLAWKELVWCQVSSG